MRRSFSFSCFFLSPITLTIRLLVLAGVRGGVLGDGGGVGLKMGNGYEQKLGSNLSGGLSLDAAQYNRWTIWRHVCVSFECDINNNERGAYFVAFVPENKFVVFRDVVWKRTKVPYQTNR